MPQVCRTCLQETAERNYIELEDDPQSIDIRSKIEFCIPEIDLTLTVRPVVCILCVNLLNSAFTFKKQCLDAEHSIKKFMFGLEGLRGTVELKDVFLFKSNIVENIQINNTDKMEHTIKVEGAAVVNDLNSLLDDALNVSLLPIPNIDIEDHDIVKIEVDSDDNDVILLDDDEDLLIAKNSGDDLQCEDNFKKTEYIIDDDDYDHSSITVLESSEKKRRGRPPGSHTTSQNSPSTNTDFAKALPCEYCDFKSATFEVLLTHINCHQDKLKSEGKPYFCPLCKLRSRWKFSIINHMKIHNIYVQTSTRRKRAGRKRAKCDKCSYVTRNSAKWEKLLAGHKCSGRRAGETSNKVSKT